MKIALLYSSKAGMASSLTAVLRDIRGRRRRASTRLSRRVRFRRNHLRRADALRTRYDVVPIESDENAFTRLRKTRPDLVFNIAERLFGPNRESHIPDALRDPRHPLHRFRPYDARDLPRQVTGQGDPLVPQDPEPRVLDRRARRRRARRTSPFRRSSSLSTKARARASRTIRSWTRREDLGVRVREIIDALQSSRSSSSGFSPGGSSRSASSATTPTMRSCRSSRSTTASCPRARGRSIPTKPNGSGTRPRSRSRSSSVRPGFRPS